MELLEKLRRSTGLTQMETRALLFVVFLFTAGWVGRSFTNQPTTHHQEAAQKVIAILDSIARQHQTLEAPMRPPTDSSVNNLNLTSNAAPRERHLIIRSPVSVSTATLEQLDRLPGIGPATAAAIIEERTRQPFMRIEDLGRVRGIGPKKLEKLRPYVRVP